MLRADWVDLRTVFQSPPVLAGGGFLLGLGGKVLGFFTVALWGKPGSMGSGLGRLDGSGWCRLGLQFSWMSDGHIFLWIGFWCGFGRLAGLLLDMFQIWGGVYGFSF